MNNTNLGINVEFFISFICQTGYASSAMNDALENHASSPGDPNKEREGEEKDFPQAVIFVVLFPLFTLLLSPSLPPRHSGLKNPTASLAYEMPPRRSQTDGKNERGKKVLLICLLTTQEKFTRCAKTRVGGGDIKTCSSSCFPPPPLFNPLRVSNVFSAGLGRGGGKRKLRTRRRRQSPAPGWSAP